MLDLSTLKISFLAGTLGGGGAERQLFYMLQTLRDAGAEARVLSLDRGACWEQPIRDLGIPVTWVGQDRSRPRRLGRIICALIRHPSEVIQSQHFYTNAYAGAAARALRRVSIGALRSNGRFDLLGCGRLGGLLNLRLPHRLAANSENGLAFAIRHGVIAARASLLPNAVDTAWFKPAANSADDPLQILAVGRLTREKRFDRFLQILRQLRQEHGLRARGVVVGAGRPDQDLRPELEHLARSMGLLPDGVVFLGGAPDLRRVYQQSALCLLTSDHEGTPNVLLEAMACGLPVVATRVGGVPEIVRDGWTGFLSAPEDVPGLISAVLRLARRPDLRRQMGARARAHVEERHGLRQLEPHLGRLYQAALGPRAAGLRPTAGPFLSAGALSWLAPGLFRRTHKNTPKAL